MQTDFCFDVESYGLHGEGFAVGVVVVDRETGEEQQSFFASCPVEETAGFVENSDTHTWLKEHVLVHLQAPTHLTPREVRHAFWKFYQSVNHKTTRFVADCGAPVEANFLRQCVLDNVEHRNFQAPYPLHELGTLLLVNGQDPVGYFTRLPAELPVHHPVCDARQSARIWRENLMTGVGKRKSCWSIIIGKLSAIDPYKIRLPRWR